MYGTMLACSDSSRVAPLLLLLPCAPRRRVHVARTATGKGGFGLHSRGGVATLSLEVLPFAPEHAPGW